MPRPPSDPHEAWRAANARQLLCAVDEVRARLELHAQGQRREPARELAALAAADEALAGHSALRVLSDRFGLTRFERLLITMCAGPELVPGFGASCAAAAGDPRRPYPTAALALAVLPDSHGAAFTPERPLRRACLVQLAGDAELAQARIGLEERTLHFLVGTHAIDERLAGLTEHIPAGRADDLATTHRDLAARIAAMWARPEQPLIQLCGSEYSGKESVLADVASRVGHTLRALRAADVPLEASQRDGLVRLWTREALLGANALMVVVDDADHPDQVRAATALVERIPGLVAVASRDPLRLRRRLAARFDLERPPADEQGSLWRGALGPLAERMNGQIAGVIAQFSLGAAGMRAAAADVRQRAADDPGEPLGALLWDACKSQARPRMDDLAQRIRPGAGWDDIVLPSDQMRLLRDIAAHVRQRARVYEQWGFGKRGERGLGISAVFAGASGTGKTMAAEVIAGELNLDLYRVDLSQVVSKYIGETEKNLRRIFDAAEEGGAVLLFDEADALFGKRSEVKDSHDRYANLEVSYLLQRMECYRGLAILTTNMRSALDTAFLRRLRFIVEFPFPGVAERAEIWRRIFPREMPRDGVDPARLSRLNVPGGVIRNIALNAAFIAADRGEPVRMHHLRHAAEIEFLKLERPINEADFGGWT